MMMSLFSVFDPVVFNFSFNWVSLFFVYFLFPCSFFLMKSKYESCYFSVVINAEKGFSDIASLNYLGLTNLVTGMFLYLVLNNVLGLFPFIFTSTTHVMFTLGLGVVFWLSFFFMGFINNIKSSLAHLVPEGSPVIMAPILVIIETISHLMRPFTLSIRLAANMMAGHLIIGLLSMVSLNSSVSFCLSIFSQSILLILEWAVSIIQGVVFGILLLMYALEYY